MASYDSRTPLLTSGFDPSKWRRQREFLHSSEPAKTSSSTVSSPRSDYPESLQGFVSLMKSTNVEGPHKLSEVHLGCKPLGSGAQFDVFGHQHFVHKEFPPFDKPYVSSIKGSGRAPVAVAIKRAKFIHSHKIAQESTSQTIGFGTPEQLRALSLEVRTLSHPDIRSHRNIVTLLAWGLDFGGFEIEVQPLSLLLILEHGNCSLRHFLSNHRRNDILPPPEQVLQHLGLDVTRGLSALHDAKIAHGDIKTDNVLVYPAEAPFFCIAKLSDFGFSVPDMKENERVYDIGTRGWQAPELSIDGVGADMLYKCDYFSLGLLILRTMIRAYDGYQATCLEEASTVLRQTNISQSTQTRILDVVQCLLPVRPSDRASGLGRVCDLLSQVDQQGFDNKGNWVQGRFDDDTPWREYEVPAYGYSIIVGSFRSHHQPKKQNSSAQLALPEKVENRYCSWLPIYEFLEELTADPGIYCDIVSHYVNGIDGVSRRPGADISGDIVGQEVSGHQLLGLCFSGRLDNGDERASVYRRKRGACAAVAAMRGYLPAQAICGQLLGDTSDVFRPTLDANNSEWQRNAVSSGYLLAWKFDHEHPEEYELALSGFRKSGGYNTHYAYNTVKKESAYSPSGLLSRATNLLDLLSKYPLHCAAALGQTSKIKRLLESGYDIDSLDISGETPLQRACMAGSASATRYLVQRGADVHAKSKHLGTVPLHWLFMFAPSEVSDIADLLVGKGKVNLDVECHSQVEAFHFPFSWPTGTPIAWAALSNRYEAIAALLRLGSSLDSVPEFFPALPDWFEDSNFHDEPAVTKQNRLLFKAWIYGSILQYQLPIFKNSFRYVVQRGALEGLERQSASKIDRKVIGRYGGELQTAASERNYNAVKRLIDAGADVNASPDKKFTPLQAAIDAPSPEIVRLLLDNGAKADLGTDNYRGNPLQRAARAGNVEIIEMLLGAGANVNSQHGRRDFTGTALYEATGLAGREVMELLLARGADCNITGGTYGTPIQRAACTEKGSLEKVEILLKHGADPNMRCGLHETALQAAASSGNAAVVRVLLKAGADPNIAGGQLWTPLQAAVIPVNYQNHEVISLLLGQGVDVNATGGEYGTAIQAAAAGGDESLVEMLLEAGALPNLKGGRNGTALQAAALTGNLKLVQLLLESGADPDAGGGSQFKTPLEAAVYILEEDIVELLLSNGADPNLLGDIDSVVLGIEQRDHDATRIKQLLLNWGADPVAKRSHLKERPSYPSSWSDVGKTRSLLVQCIRRGSGEWTAPKLLADIILRQAEYLPQVFLKNDNKIEVTKDSPEEPFLRIKIEGSQASDIKPREIAFRIKSHDGGNVKPSERNGRYGNSNTFFEVEVYSASTSKARRLLLQKNFHGSRGVRTHEIFWDADDADPNISGIVRTLVPGDELRVFPKSSGESSINHVVSMEARVLYYYASPPSRPTPGARISNRQDEEKGETSGALGHVQGDSLSGSGPAWNTTAPITTNK